jgi:beta-mannosidase
MDLGGVWRATKATDELRRVFADLHYNEQPGNNQPGNNQPGNQHSGPDWFNMAVPSHWRSNSALATNDSPILCRRQFDAPAPAAGRRSWLKFDGIFYQGDVWLDGAYVGDTEGYFLPHDFDVTQQLRERSDHVLAVEVTCPPQTNRVAKRSLTGVFQHWDCIDPNWNPGGIWQGVTLEETGSIRIKRLRCICLSASTERAELAIRAVVDSLHPGIMRLRSEVGTTLHEFDHAVAAGSNRVEWRVVVERPKLWWPASLGTPHLTDVRVSVFETSQENEPPSGAEEAPGSTRSTISASPDTNPPSEQVSDTRTFRTGLRQVRMKNWIFTINGERIHMKGANLGPTRMAIGDATPTELRRDVELAREAGLDFIRIHAHVTHPAFYEAADELGMMLWQDMPLQWGYARTVRKQAVRQASEAIDLLGHHPSIIHWCGHNEPIALDINPETMSGPPKKAAEMMGRFLLLQQLPTWNKSVLDFAIHRALSKSDPSRPTTAHSGILPGPFSGGTDSHLYFGWYHGKEHDFPRLLRAFPRMARFVSEFGAQAVPVDSDFCEPLKWPDLDWERLGHDHALQKSFFDRVVPPANFRTFDDWKDATQTYQAVVLRRHIEELRRIKYRPNGGFALFSLADALDHRAVTWAILGHDRQPKRAYEAVQEACRPVIVTMDRPPEVVTVGQAVTFDVHVVSDIRHVLRGATVNAQLHWPGGSHSWSWRGDLAADACTRIGAVDFVVPSPVHPSAIGHRLDNDAALSSLRVDLTLDHSEATATNRYESRFV